MTGYESQIREIFLNKPECIINFPEWMLSKDEINRYRKLERLAIVEMAGRDSVAAAIKGIEEYEFSDLLPTYVYTGTEFGNWQSVINAIERLKQKLPKEIRVHDLLVFGSPGFWQALNGRYASDLMNKYGFYTPCIGCHLYLHTTRIPLAVLLGNRPIIAGERENHDGSIKINQISKALDSYEDLAGRLKISLLMPLRQRKDGSQIEKIIGSDWKQDKDQPGCVLSGNYRDPQGNNMIKKQDAVNLLDNFLVPCAEKIIGVYLEGSVPDHKEIAKQQILDA